MTGMRKQYVAAELADGRVIGPMRTIHADKIALERTARARNWDVEKQFATTQAFLSWAAAKRTGNYSGTYEEWLEELVQATIDAGDEVDPTQTGQSPD